MTQTQNTDKTETILAFTAAKDLARVLANVVLFTAPKADARPVLCCVRMVVKQGESTAEFMATDSYALAWDHCELAAAALEDVDILIDRDTVAAVVKMVKGSYQAMVTLAIATDAVGGARATFECVGASVAGVLYTWGEFPRVEMFRQDPGEMKPGPFALGVTQLARLGKVQPDDKPAKGVATPVTFTFVDALKAAHLTIGSTFSAVVMPVKIR